MTKFLRLLCLCSLLTMFCCGAVSAADVRIGRFNIIYGQVGNNPLLDFVSLDQIQDDAKDDVEALVITRVFTEAEKREIELAVRYWSERMGVNTPIEQVDIYAGFIEASSGASAFSLSPASVLVDELTIGISPNGTVYDKFLLGRRSPYPPGLADNIIIFETDYSPDPTRLLLNDDSIMSTMIHELGHALGMVGDHTVDPGGTTATFEPGSFTRWNDHLHDVFGVKARPGMNIEMNVRASSDINDPAIFQIFAQDGAFRDYRYATFNGRNVNALTGGLGMPVMGGFSGGDNVMDGGNSLGHPGLMQSIMSYGIIRNMPFTEMELASFQDMGYTLDRSQFFGKSYYYNVGGNNQVNRLPFGTARNPNTAIFGLGTHIMRNGLTLVQAADIYAGGYGGGGIRIDGVSNTLTVSENVTVAANGLMGTGLLVSYGSLNSIFLNGRVEAVGSGGIGAHFGIQAAGHGLMIGSYMPNPVPAFPDFYDFPIQTQHEYFVAYQDLAGPLVENFVISGRLTGQLAAIRIEEDAHVANISVRSGAVVSGDIVSSWDRHTWGGDYSTTITFGEDGKSGSMRLDGDIISESATNSLDIVQSGGRLVYNSQSNGANVYSWEIRDGAVLAGDSHITIDSLNWFQNAGTVSPGNHIGTITIDGNYYQDATGHLLMEFTRSETDRFIVTGDANIYQGGTLSLEAHQDFYATDSQRSITNEELFGPGSSLAIANFVFDLERSRIKSPTLDSWWDKTDLTSPIIHITRASDAYSRFGSNSTGTSVGRVLDSMVGDASGDLQNLFAAIDFTSGDGSGVRSALRQLVPTIHDNTAKASLHMSHKMSGLLLDRITSVRIPLPAPGFTDGEISSVRQSPDDNVFVFPLVGYFGQSRWADNNGFNSIYGGAMGGVNRHFENGLYGLHAAVFHRDTSNRSEAPARSRANGIRIGAHGALLPREGYFIGALASVGLENTNVTRNVEVNGYHRTNNSSFTAFTAQSSMRAGYEWERSGLRLGPLGGFDYGYYRRPSVTETNGQATSLRLDAANFHSLRSAIGWQIRTQKPLSGGRTLHTGLDFQWMHEMLNTDYGSTAYFADYGSSGFQVKNRTNDRDALAVNASVSLLSADSVNISAYLGTELFRNGSNSVQGGFSANWRF